MFAMFVPTIRNGLSEEEAIQIYTGFSKRPMDEVKERIQKHRYVRGCWIVR